MYETPTLETEMYGHPFVISGDEQSLIDMAEQLRNEQRREYATYIAKWAVTAPMKASMALVTGIGRAIAQNVSEIYEDYTLRSHDERFGTHLYDRKQQLRVNARTHALEQRIGL